MGCQVYELFCSFLAGVPHLSLFARAVLLCSGRRALGPSVTKSCPSPKQESSILASQIWTYTLKVLGSTLIEGNFKKWNYNVNNVMNREIVVTVN